MVSDYDGIGWGHGPARPWSHYGWVDSRCDAMPTYVDWANAYECRVCEKNRGNRWVFSEQYVLLRGIFEMPRTVGQLPEAIRGFRWVSDGSDGWYERIRNPEQEPERRHVAVERYWRISPIWWVVVVAALWAVCR